MEETTSDFICVGWRVNAERKDHVRDEMSNASHYAEKNWGGKK